MWCCSGTENLWALLSAIIEFLCPSTAQYCTNQRVLRQYFASFSCKACSSIFFDEHRSAWLFQAVKQLIIFTFFQARVDSLLCCFANRVLWWKWHWNHRWTLDLAEARLCLASKAIAKWTSKSLAELSTYCCGMLQIKEFKFLQLKMSENIQSNRDTTTIPTLLTPRENKSRNFHHLDTSQLTLSHRDSPSHIRQAMTL